MRIRFHTDQEHDDSTGLYNYDARLYDPAIGMFISADSIVPDWYNPQGLNRYAYVLNNPLKYFDPSGHEAVFDDEGYITSDTMFPDDYGAYQETDFGNGRSGLVLVGDSHLGSNWSTGQRIDAYTDYLGNYVTDYRGGSWDPLGDSLTLFAALPLAYASAPTIMSGLGWTAKTGIPSAISGAVGGAITSEGDPTSIALGAAVGMAVPIARPAKTLFDACVNNFSASVAGQLSSGVLKTYSEKELRIRNFKLNFPAAGMAALGTVPGKGAAAVYTYMRGGGYLAPPIIEGAFVGTFEWAGNQ